MSRKGGEWEREFCRLLTYWWSEGKAQDVLFWRTAGSGGRSTLRGRKGKSAAVHSGDICSIDEEGKPFTDLITVEAKRGYSKASIADILDCPDKSAQQLWEAFWQQTIEAQIRAGTPYWMIITRRDKRDPFIFIPLSLILVLRKVGALSLLPQPYITLNLTLRCKEGTEKRLVRGQRVAGMRLQDFFSLVKPIHIKRIWFASEGV